MATTLPANRLPDADDHNPPQLQPGDVQFNKQMLTWFAATPNGMLCRLNVLHNLYHEKDGTLTVDGLIALRYDAADQGRTWYGFYTRDEWREATDEELLALGISR